jgi:pimeloyl-ACP methyl ester carboxylesterase
VTTPTVLIRFSCPNFGHQTGMTTSLLGADRVGAGEPLVLMHGLGSTRGDFAGLLPVLQQHFDVVSLDLPGHGSSPALTSRPTIQALTGAVSADLDAR